MRNTLRAEALKAYATVGQDSVFFVRHSSANSGAPNLLLLHGAGGNHQHWGHVVRMLGAVTTHPLDLPSHGRSGGGGRTSISDYAEFVGRFMDVLRLEQAILGGHSMGGATAMMMALNCPERVAGLVLMGTGARLRVTLDSGRNSQPL